jgi:hypothetical protein
MILVDWWALPSFQRADDEAQADGNGRVLFQNVPGAITGPPTAGGGI